MKIPFTIAVCKCGSHTEYLLHNSHSPVIFLLLSLMLYMLSECLFSRPGTSKRVWVFRGAGYPLVNIRYGIQGQWIIKLIWKAFSGDRRTILHLSRGKISKYRLKLKLSWSKGTLNMFISETWVSFTIFYKGVNERNFTRHKQVLRCYSDVAQCL